MHQTTEQRAPPPDCIELIEYFTKTIPFVIERAPGCLTTTDTVGYPPLHCAVHCEVSFDHICLVLDEFATAKEAYLSTSKQGGWPSSGSAIADYGVQGIRREFQNLITTDAYRSSTSYAMRRLALGV